VRTVDGFTLSREHRALLRPGELLPDTRGGVHRLPRFFYEIASWEEAKSIKLTSHFTLAELMSVDSGEADLLLRNFPHYVPCTVSVLARYLEEFRMRVDAPVSISVNGGYRSPAHRLFGDYASTHLWATAADIFRIGETWIDSAKAIDKYAQLAEAIGPEVLVRRFGHGPGETDDHLHMDIGFVTLVPHGCSEL
jgi:hypothetical protein